MPYCHGGGSALVRAVALVALLLACVLPTSHGELPAATSSRQAREQAEKLIPWNHLDAENQKDVRHLIDNASLYRRLPTRVIDCDPLLFNFLTEHPEVVTDVWKLMGVGVLDVSRTGPGTFAARDAAGTVGTLRYLSQRYSPEARNTLLMLGEGEFAGAPLPRPVKAKCVILLRSGSTIETNNRPYVTAVVDTWIVLDRTALDLVARTLQPVVAKAADHNFTETMKFVSTFSQTAEKNPEGMARLAQKLSSTDPATRDELSTLARGTAKRYAALQAEPTDVRVATATQ